MRRRNPIVRDPEILGGTPVFRGTRVPFRNLIDHLMNGHSLDHFVEQFPSVTREAAITALEHAAELVVDRSKWLEQKVGESIAAVERGAIIPDEKVRAWIEQREEFKPVEIKGEPLSKTIRRERR